VHYQFVPFLDVVEYFFPEDEIPAIDPNLGVIARAHPANNALVVRLGQMKRDRRVYGYETSYLAAFPLFLKRSIISGSGASVRPSL
jgi:hypothetical protein